MKRSLAIATATLAALVCFAPVPAAAAPPWGTQRYEVTVTNLTRGQILSSPVVIAHDSSFDLFVPGEAASPELAQLAQDAVTDPLLALLSVTPSVYSVEVASMGVPPGESRSVEIETRGRFREFTVAGMLVTTNDAFYAARGVLGPSRSTLVGNAWDAGSEANTEDCDHIPGPPCGHPLATPPESGEGFVHIHAGIHGGADLAAADFDWRNPTVLVSVRRLTSWDGHAGGHGGGDDESD